MTPDGGFYDSERVETILRLLGDYPEGASTSDLVDLTYFGVKTVRRYIKELQRRGNVQGAVLTRPHRRVVYRLAHQGG